MAGLSNGGATLYGCFWTIYAQRFIGLRMACVLVECPVAGQMITVLSRAIFAFVSYRARGGFCDRREAASS
jgi:hypothetical protein